MNGHPTNMNMAEKLGFKLDVKKSIQSFFTVTKSVFKLSQYPFYEPIFFKTNFSKIFFLFFIPISRNLTF